MLCGPTQSSGQALQPSAGSTLGLYREVVKYKVLPQQKIAVSDSCPVPLSLLMLSGLWDFFTLHAEGIIGYDYDV